MTIVGSRKMIVYDDVDNEAKLKIYDKGVHHSESNVFGEFQYRLRTGDIYIPRVDLTEPLHIECGHLFKP